MKQPGIFFVLFGALYLFGSDWRSQFETKKILFRNLQFISGVATPCLITVVLLWICGTLGTFWFWTVQYATQYGRQVPLTEGVHVFAVHFLGVIGTAWPIWALGLIGFVVCVLGFRLSPGARFLVPFAACSAIAVCPGLYFRPHYFILFLPAVSLFAAAAIVAGVERLQNAKSRLSVPLLLIFAACLVWPLFAERDFFFERPLAEANRMVNGTNPFPESIKIADFLRNESTTSDTIAVLGSEPQIYFYSQRRSATGYIYTYSLMEAQPYASQMQQEMIREIEAARPKFLVLVVISKSWLAGPDSDLTIFQWADNYCDANYDEVGLVNISEEGSEYYLSNRPPYVKPTAEHILIYRRKA